MYITDHYGIRLSINCGVGLNLAGSLIRLLSSVPLIQNAIARQVLLHLGKEGGLLRTKHRVVNVQVR